MEFFKQVDLDWMGKAKYFFALSLALLVVGGASLIKNGGPYYGIDFKGGTVVDVRFAGPPPIDTIRNGLTQQGIVNSTIVPVSDIANPNTNEVLINLEERVKVRRRSTPARQPSSTPCTSRWARARPASRTLTR